MKKAIVTGAYGFLGRGLVKELRQAGTEVFAVGLSRHRKRAFLENGVLFGAADEMDETDWERYGYGADVFYHLAWAGSAGEGRGNALLQAQNVKDTMGYLEIAKRLGCEKWVMAGTISSCEASRKTEEGISPAKTDSYGWAKEAAWQMCRSAGENMKIIQGCITNIYGEGENSGRLVCHTIRQILEGKIPAFTEGKQLYDFLYISDAAAAFRLLGEKGKNGKNYLLGSNGVKPLRQWMEELLEVMEAEGRFGVIPYEGPFLSKEDFDTKELEEDTGFSCKVSFREGIRKTADWQREADLWRL